MYLVFVLNVACEQAHLFGYGSMKRDLGSGSSPDNITR